MWGGGLALIFGAGEMLTPTTVLARDGTLSQGVYGTGLDRVLHSSVVVGGGKGLALILEAGEMLTPTLVLAWDGTVPQDGRGVWL